MRWTRPPYRPSASWWRWPTILSIDAPAILLVWQALAAHAAAIPLGWAPRVVLAASVWLAYVVDRWLEGWRLPESIVETPRHRFYQRWRWPVAGVAAAVLAGDVALAVAALPADDLLAGFCLASAAATYVLSHQWLHRDAPWRVPKELLIAILLAAALWLFIRRGASSVVFPSVGLFALLGLTNTCLISKWEIDVDRRHGQSSIARHGGRAAPFITALPWITALAALLVCVIAEPSVRAVAGCALASALLLAACDAIEPRAGWAVARVCADAALLTPLVALGWM